MAKKKPFYVRSLLKLKPKIRAMEEELKKQKQSPKQPAASPTKPTKSWSINWKFSWTLSPTARMILFIIAAFLIVWMVSPEPLVTISVETTTEVHR